MAHSSAKHHTIAALVLLGVVAAVCVSLGNWQLRRAAQRDTIKLAIEDGRSHPPLQLNAHTPHKELINWRPAVVSGTWLDKFTVLLENRNFKGMPGFWVATPLLIAPDTAVLVLRGWVARPLPPADMQPSIPAPKSGVAIEGELLNRVPRLFELWSFGKRTEGQLPAKLPTANLVAPKVQNLDLADYAKASGLTLLPSILEQTSDDHDQLGREWPQPSIDADTNRGYALQWFSFAAVAAIAWLA
ncbi:MAG TPA: SURF1 family protein, partial [Paralcaligenes sp.]